MFWGSAEKAMANIQDVPNKVHKGKKYSSFFFVTLNLSLSFKNSILLIIYTFSTRGVQILATCLPGYLYFV